jgi:hypothetical protein
LGERIWGVGFYGRVTTAELNIPSNIPAKPTDNPLYPIIGFGICYLLRNQSLSQKPSSAGEVLPEDMWGFGKFPRVMLCITTEPKF